VGVEKRKISSLCRKLNPDSHTRSLSLPNVVLSDWLRAGLPESHHIQSSPTGHCWPYCQVQRPKFEGHQYQVYYMLSHTALSTLTSDYLRYEEESVNRSQMEIKLLYPQCSSTLWNYSTCGVYTVESEAGC
jgi:hypothetical protein